jgi:hypothetical protein
VSFREFIASDHDGVLPDGWVVITDWMAERFEGAAARGDCAT